ncbi:hypothetical protein ANCDUO_24685 [Ancylostoma duodenale]|uniref:Uncharacterized protein n=1 Tax=Ancylostoma duodenale TaxID=51022 RepID=A0A0C2C6M2_9BILA|nr:hypothetical protein ANCDUO_24685 [Ancylostoma duodenale]
MATQANKTVEIPEDQKRPKLWKFLKIVEITLNVHYDFIYSFILTNDASLTTELNVRINAGWMKFRATSGYSVTERSATTSSQIYQTVIRPAALYSSECWPVTKEIERLLRAMEAKMLRWASGVTRLDHVPNEDMR